MIGWMLGSCKYNVPVPVPWKKRTDAEASTSKPVKNWCMSLALPLHGPSLLSSWVRPRLAGWARIFTDAAGCVWLGVARNWPRVEQPLSYVSLTTRWAPWEKESRCSNLVRSCIFIIVISIFHSLFCWCVLWFWLHTLVLWLGYDFLTHSKSR